MTELKRSRLGSIALATGLSIAALTGSGGPTEAQSQPTQSDRLHTNSANCLTLGFKSLSGPVESRFRMTVDRRYTLLQGGQPVADITDQLISSPGANNYDDFDWDGQKIGEVSRVDARSKDYRISLAGGGQPQVMRARYGENQVQTRAYRLEKVGNSWENTGDTLYFKKDQPDGEVEVINLCGQPEMRPAIKVEKWRLLLNNQVREVKNRFVMLAKDCLFEDFMLSDHFLRERNQPPQPPVQEPSPETPGRPPEKPPYQVPQTFQN